MIGLRPHCSTSPVGLKRFFMQPFLQVEVSPYLRVQRMTHQSKTSILTRCNGRSQKSAHLKSSQALVNTELSQAMPARSATSHIMLCTISGTQRTTPQSSRPRARTSKGAGATPGSLTEQPGAGDTELVLAMPPHSATCCMMPGTILDLQRIDPQSSKPLVMI